MFKNSQRKLAEGDTCLLFQHLEANTGKWQI